MLKRLNLYEKALVISTILLPFTLLRFGALGVGELILILLFFIEFKKRKFNFLFKEFIFTKFWTLYLIISLIGFSYNVIILKHATGTFEGMLFDFLAYFLILLASYTVESYNKRGCINFFKILKYVFYGSSIILTTLYIISFFTPSIFGLRLRYYIYFTPLVKNLHQISMFIVPLPFVGALLIEQEKKYIVKLVIIIFIILLTSMALETGSFKALAGIYVGFVVYFFLKLIGYVSGRNRNIILYLSVIISVVFLLLYLDSINIVLQNIFNEEDNHDSRSHIYSKALSVGFNSPVFGLGTGPHVLNGGKFWDAHQTLLSIFLQTGLLGLFWFFWFLIKLVKKTFKSVALFSALIPLGIYLLGGDILRRLPIWLLLMFFYYCAINFKTYTNE